MSGLDDLLKYASDHPVKDEPQPAFNEIAELIERCKIRAAEAAGMAAPTYPCVCGELRGWVQGSDGYIPCSRCRPELYERLEAGEFSPDGLAPRRKLTPAHGPDAASRAAGEREPF